MPSLSVSAADDRGSFLPFGGSAVQGVVFLPHRPTVLGSARVTVCAEFWCMFSPVFVWVSSGFSSFFLRPKNIVVGKLAVLNIPEV